MTRLWIIMNREFKLKLTGAHLADRLCLPNLLIWGKYRSNIISCFPGISHYICLVTNAAFSLHSLISVKGIAATFYFEEPAEFKLNFHFLFHPISSHGPHSALLAHVTHTHTSHLFTLLMVPAWAAQPEGWLKPLFLEAAGVLHIYTHTHTCPLLSSPSLPSTCQLYPTAPPSSCVLGVCRRRTAKSILHLCLSTCLSIFWVPTEYLLSEYLLTEYSDTFKSTRHFQECPGRAWTASFTSQM